MSVKPWIFVVCVALSAQVAADGRQLATGGLMPIEGGAGGGMTPWAVIAGYGAEDEWGATLAMTWLDTGDYRLGVIGAAIGWRNRIEMSVAQQTLELPTLADDLGLAAGTEIRQNIFSAKLRVAGDLVYGNWPQIAVGVQFKSNLTPALPLSVGAVDDSGVDVYLSATRLWLDGPFGRRLVVNGTLRRSSANDAGLLGFGGDRSDSPDWLAEASVGVFLDEDVIVGIEYRQQTDNLSAAASDDWTDVFIGFVPNKQIALAAAWVNLGTISTIPNQKGLYLSIQGSF